MASDHTAVHLLAGGAGGTAGAVITCPLEVVKTRLQSSVHTKAFSTYIPSNNGQGILCPQRLQTASYSTCSTAPTQTKMLQAQAKSSTGLYQCLKHIVQYEGPAALFKGLGPNLVGVAPSRAIYFYSYAQAKSFFNENLAPETPLVHICSAATAGFTASTATNPIWFVKTRLQLDHKKKGHLTTSQCIREVYQKDGIRGFYKGITASYYGISETVIHFVIYEAIKAKLREMKGRNSIDEDFDDRTAFDFVEFMAAGATSKTIATCVAYPHEVARTRLREEGNKYRHFWQTLHRVFLEEGYRGLYRGLTTQLVRQIPNTAIVMSTYEAVVYLCHKHMY